MLNILVFTFSIYLIQQIQLVMSLFLRSFYAVVVCSASYSIERNECVYCYDFQTAKYSPLHNIILYRTLRYEDVNKWFHSQEYSSKFLFDFLAFVDHFPCLLCAILKRFKIDRTENRPGTYRSHICDIFVKITNARRNQLVFWELALHA